MMNWFRKKKKTETDPIVKAPASGQLVEQADLPDVMFAQGMMGEAFGIDSEDGLVAAPFDGEVMMTFPTGHAIGLKRPDGLEFLIHIGVDTVTLRGEGFDLLVCEHQKVRAGDPMVRFHPDQIRAHGLSPIVICAFSSPIDSKEKLSDHKEVQAGEALYSVTAGKSE